MYFSLICINTYFSSILRFYVWEMLATMRVRVCVYVCVCVSMCEHVCACVCRELCIYVSLCLSLYTCTFLRVQKGCVYWPHGVFKDVCIVPIEYLRMCVITEYLRMWNNTHILSTLFP